MKKIKKLTRFSFTVAIIVGGGGLCLNTDAMNSSNPLVKLAKNRQIRSRGKGQRLKAWEKSKFNL